jgi:hypothetical protein
MKTQNEWNSYGAFGGRVGGWGNIGQTTKVLTAL